MRKFVFLLTLLAALMMTTTGCERIDAGHVGMKVNLYGSDKGVSDVEVVTGRVLYNPFATEIHEWPTFMRTVNVNVEVTMNDGMVITLPLTVNYSIEGAMASSMFEKFRKHPDELDVTYMPTQIRAAYNEITSGYSVEDFISKKEEILSKAKQVAKTKLATEGFAIDTITLAAKPGYPPSVVKSIEMKIQATQDADRKERELQQKEADAAKAVAEAKGAADSAIESARGEAEAQKLAADAKAYRILKEAEAQAKAIDKVTKALNKDYIEYVKAESWDGKLPTTMAGSDTGILLDARK